MSTQAIGIDFGTTKTLVAYLHPGEKRPETLRLGRGTDFVPTTAAIDAGGQIFFGDEAEDMLEDPSVAYLRGFKMELGSKTPLYMLEKNVGSIKPLTAQELAGEFLRRLRLNVQEKVFMGGDVTEAVITCPVKFSTARCEALKEAAHAAGFTRVALTTEPEAAGQAFCRLNTAEAFRGNALIIDWGGGTLDIALVSRQGNSIVKHSELTDGDISIGGERFDERLWKHAATQLKGAHLNPVTQMPRVRKAKEQLSSQSPITLRLSTESGPCPPLDITRELLDSLIEADVNKAAAMVQSLLARAPADMKPEILLLVGGSSAIPLIREKLEAATGLPARSWQYSREAVALGAALMVSDEQTATETNANLDKALLKATAGSDTQAVRELLSRGANANAKDEDGNTPLHYTAVKGRTDEVRLLLEGRADVNAKGVGRFTPLHEAVYWGQSDVTRLLLEAGADINAVDEYGKTPLHWAAETGHTDMARQLLEAGADIHAKDEDGKTPLLRASETGHIDIVNLLVEPDSGAQNEDDCTKLHRTDIQENTGIISRPGAQTNLKTQDKNLTLPLHRATMEGDTSAIRALLEAGADVNEKDADGHTPLRRALRWARIDVISLLIEAGADVNGKDKDGCTLLHRAARHGNTDAVRALLKAGADVNGASRWKETPLDLAIQLGRTNCISVLREFGGKRSWQSSFRVTMKYLMWALLAGIILYAITASLPFY